MWETQADPLAITTTGRSLASDLTVEYKQPVTASGLWRASQSAKFSAWRTGLSAGGFLVGTAGLVYIESELEKSYASFPDFAEDFTWTYDWAIHMSRPTLGGR
jgi:hypothetical protein